MIRLCNIFVILFLVQVNGIEDKGLEFQRFSLTAVTPQKIEAAKASMPPRYSGFREESLELSCNVKTQAPFVLYWYKANEIVGGPYFFGYG